MNAEKLKQLQAQVRIGGKVRATQLFVRYCVSLNCNHLYANAVIFCIKTPVCYNVVYCTDDRWRVLPQLAFLFPRTRTISRIRVRIYLVQSHRLQTSVCSCMQTKYKNNAIYIFSVVL